MINAQERGQDQTIKWHFPDDTEDPTIWTLTKVKAIDRLFLQTRRMQETGEVKREDWVADTLLTGIESVGNFKNIEGKVVTLKEPGEIMQAIDALDLSELQVLIAAIVRDKEIIDAGRLEKNSESPSE